MLYSKSNADRMSAKELETFTMLNWAITFFLIAIIAAFLGFGGVAGTAAGAGNLLLQVFLVVFVLGLIFRMARTA